MYEFICGTIGLLIACLFVTSNTIIWATLLIGVSIGVVVGVFLRIGAFDVVGGLFEIIGDIFTICH